MPVQRSRSRPTFLRVRAALLVAAIPTLAVGCAQTRAETEAPVAGERDPELAQLRRENAALRTRVQNLEERVRLLEHGDAWGSAEPSPSAEGYASYGSNYDADDQGEALDGEPSRDERDLDGPRQLPVVKLTPEGRSVERPAGAQQTQQAQQQGAGSRRGSIALSPVPHSGAPIEAGGGYVVDARGEVDYGEGGGDSGYAEPNEADAGGEPASYRLVGSKLVQATKRKQSSKPRRDRDSGVVKDYKAAMVLYQDGRYSEAEQAFSAIVSAHPQHDYADNALYWQGEAAYDQAHYSDALAAFTKVVERYGGGNKAPDALLKIGLCYGRLGDAANARDVLTQLIAAYPRANASKIAKRKLADLDD